MRTHLFTATFCLSSALLMRAATNEPPRAPSRAALTPTAAERDSRLGWWRDARFGMFVHWGVYSGLSGTWHGKAYGGYAEHIQRMAKIPIPVYRQEVAGTFNPTEFNADEWIRLAKAAGMGYFVITAKHHDGFAMFDSEVSDYNIVKATPFARDPMKELRAACQKYGVKFGFYYSHAFDWGEANGPGNDWDYENPGGDKLLHGADWWTAYPEFLPRARNYVDEKSIPQLLELIKHYDPDIIWFDTPHKLPPEENLRILAAVRQAKPNLVVNGRLVAGLGDYESTCDRPAEFPPHEEDWEGVPTTNESYGYNENDQSHKPVAHFIRLLAKSAARGGNELMNIGPMGNGKMAAADVTILKGIGAWWGVNGASIRGTTRTPLAVQAWGESTRQGNRLYLHVFDWPTNGNLVVGGLKTETTKVWLMADAGRPLAAKRQGLDLRVSVPTTPPDAVDSVIVLECSTTPEADSSRVLSSTVATNTLRAFDANISGKLQFGPGKASDDWVFNWNRKAAAVLWPVRVNEKVTFAVAINYDAPSVTKTSRGIEGDAGKETAAAHKGAGGTYGVQIGRTELTGTVRPGNQVTEALGKVTLDPGNYEIRVSATKITGEELMRLRKLTLKPLTDSINVVVDTAPRRAAVAVTATNTGNNQLLYFTSSSLTADDRHLVFISDRTGDPNLFTRDLVTNQERQLTTNTEGALKSYVYFDGHPYRGFGKGSVSLDPSSGTTYYIQGREIRSVTLAGNVKVLAALPTNQMTAFTHVSADGSRLCVPTTDARALDGEKQLAGKPNYDIDKRIQDENLCSYIRVFDTVTGAQIHCEPVPKAWVTHVQFSPVNPDLILYNHEWCADSGIRRMWLWDGKAHLRLRPEGEGRNRNDWTCHEMWERDGSAIIYHGSFTNGVSYIGRVFPDGSGRTEIPLPADWKSYGHFTVGKPGELVTDGCYQEPADQSWGGAWISRLKVDWELEKIEWFPLVRHGSSWKSQDCHPHPVFNHAADAIWFTSDPGGTRAVYQQSLNW